jgi:ABC-type multidrug transport system fused ATPase/permease subunit
MEYLFYAVLVIVPSAMVFGVAYYFLNKVNKDKAFVYSGDLRKDRQKHILPMKVEAYQRLILFLERIHPNSLVMRVHNPAKVATLMQHELLEQIRSEFEHNIAQQMFVSPQAWEMVKRSKDELIQLVHIAGKQMESTSMATDLSAKIFELTAQVDPFPTEIAIQFVKDEFQSLFK